MHKIDTEIFKGPMDLLLYLVKKQEVNIGDICIEKMIGEYLSYLENLEEFNIDIASEFTSMASYLMLLKSISLLPEKIQMEDDFDMEDPFQSLIQQLIEYKTFKETAQKLEKMSEKRQNIFPNAPTLYSPIQKEINLEEVRMEDLFKIFDEISKAFEARNTIQEISDEMFTVEQKISEILQKLENKEKQIITNLFKEMGSKGEIIVTFLALLELVKMRRINFFRGGGEIQIQLSPQESD